MHTDLSPPRRARSPVRHDADAGRSIMDQAISRAAGARRIDGNSVRLLRDAAEIYPAWLYAIAGAER
jgi:cardiolipin synthase